MASADAQPSIFTCPNCGTRNRVPADRLNEQRFCGHCHRRFPAPGSGEQTGGPNPNAWTDPGTRYVGTRYDPDQVARLAEQLELLAKEWDTKFETLRGLMYRVVSAGLVQEKVTSLPATAVANRAEQSYVLKDVNHLAKRLEMWNAQGASLANALMNLVKGVGQSIGRSKRCEGHRLLHLISWKRQRMF